MSSKQNCPQCGTARVARILYGLPILDDDLRLELSEKKVILGGCVIGQGSPTHQCVECGHSWGRMDFQLVPPKEDVSSKGKDPSL